MDLLVSLLVLLIVFGLAWWALQRVAAGFGLPPPIVTVVEVLIVIAAVITLARMLSGLPHVKLF